MLISLIGPPLSGKSTTARLLADRLECSALSTGQLCRDFGLRPKDIEDIKRSDRVESLDEMVTSAVEHFVTWNPRCVLDGFPRSVAQHDKLRSVIGSSREWLIVYVLVNPVLQLTRMESRGRPDVDNIEVVANRNRAALNLFTDLSERCSETYGGRTHLHALRCEGDGAETLCEEIIQIKGGYKE